MFFRRSDVLVTGDVFDQTRFPVIEREKGGSIQGVIDSLNRIIGITVPPIPFIWQEGGTVVVPGHGLISHEADVVDYRDMVTIVRDRIQSWIGKGMTLDQVRKADPVKGFRGRYGSNTGAWTTDKFVEAVYREPWGKVEGQSEKVRSGEVQSEVGSQEVRSGSLVGRNGSVDCLRHVPSGHRGTGSGARSGTRPGSGWSRRQRAGARRTAADTARGGTD